MRSPLVLAALALVTILAGCGNGGGGAGAGSSNSSSTGSGSADAAQLCVDTINQLRATLNLPAYERWTDGEDCAGQEAEMDSQSQAAHGAFGMCGEHAQDECPGWPGPPASMIGGCLMQMWAEGPGSDFSKHGHFINMSSTDYTKVACGYHVLDDGSVWAAQNFQ
jgi:hypothetical protein